MNPTQALKLMRAVLQQGRQRASKRYGRNNIMRALAFLRSTLKTGA